jgi:uncharacterized protein YjbI with pentapeptide repeats
LRHADLSDANLSHAELSDATLENAALRGANLSGADGISNEVSEQQADSLKRATMPNGQKYEDGLKSRGEENNGSQSAGPSGGVCCQM